MVTIPNSWDMYTLYKSHYIYKVYFCSDIPIFVSSKDPSLMTSLEADGKGISNAN